MFGTLLNLVTPKVATKTVTVATPINTPTLTYVVWSRDMRVASEHNTREEAEYFAKAYGKGYWISTR
jgi:hypothetical protein